MKIKTENYEIKLNKSGLRYKSPHETKFKRLCGYVKVKYQGATKDGTSWIIVCKFIDNMGKLRSLAIPRESIYENDVAAKAFIKAGLNLELNYAKKAFREYIYATIPTQTVVLYSSAGWVDENIFFRGKHRMPETDKLTKLLPNLAKDLASVSTKGTLKQWQRNIADKCPHSPYLLYAHASWKRVVGVKKSKPHRDRSG